LITGPANAKTELVEFIYLHDPKLSKVIAGVETVDHPTVAQLIAYARKYLRVSDRMEL
jgi:peptide subunit release factor 1 (eRF1)